MDEVNDDVDGAQIDGLTQQLLDNDQSRRRKRAHEWVCLDQRTVRICWQMLFKTSLPHACRNVKFTYLFKTPFRIFDQNARELHMKPEFFQYFERNYKQFAKDFLDAYMVYGIVCYVIVQDKNGHYYPRILAPNTYVIQMAYVTETEKRYYRVWRPTKYSIKHTLRKTAGQGVGNVFGGMSTTAPQFIGSRAFSGLGGSIGDAMVGGLGGGNAFNSTSKNWYVDEDVVVIDGLGHDPFVDGSINSPLSTIIPDVIFTNSLSTGMLQAEEQLVNPMLIMQYHKNVDADTALDPSLAHNMPVFKSDEMGLQAQRATEMMQEQLEALNRQFSVLRKIEKQMGSAEYQEDRDPRKEVQVTPRVISLPKGLEYVRPDGNERHAGHRYMPQRDHLDDATARIFGIPLTMLRNVGVLRGFQDAHKENFRNQIGEDATMLGNIMSMIFNEIYGHTSDFAEMGFMRRKEVVDDTHFTDLPKGRMGKNDDTNINIESTRPLPPVEEKLDLFKERNANPKPGPKSVMTEHDRQEKIKDIRRRNVEFRKAMSEGKLSDANRRRYVRNETGSKGPVTIIINTSIHAEAKTVKHAWDIGAVTDDDYRSIIRAKIGLGRVPYKPQPKFIDRVVDVTMRAPGSEPPRADAQMPEGEMLATTAKKFEAEQKPSPAILSEAVRKRKISVCDVQEQRGPKIKESNDKKDCASKEPPKKKAKKDGDKDKKEKNKDK